MSICYLTRPESGGWSARDQERCRRATKDAVSVRVLVASTVPPAVIGGCFTSSVSGQRTDAPSLKRTS